MRTVLNRLMPNIHLAVVPLRVVLVLLFLVLVLFQVMSLPGQWKDVDPQSLRWPLTIFSVLMVACMQVVVVCIWRLLSMVRDDRIFSERSFVWVDAIVWAIVSACLLLLAASIYVELAVGWGDPGIPMMIILMLLAGTVLALLMVVMRALLWQATTLRTDMEAVI